MKNFVRTLFFIGLIFCCLVGQTEAFRADKYFDRPIVDIDKTHPRHSQMCWLAASLNMMYWLTQDVPSVAMILDNYTDTEILDRYIQEYGYKNEGETMRRFFMDLLPYADVLEMFNSYWESEHIIRWGLGALMQEHSLVFGVTNIDDDSAHVITIYGIEIIDKANAKLWFVDSDDGEDMVRCALIHYFTINDLNTWMFIDTEYIGLRIAAAFSLQKGVVYE